MSTAPSPSRSPTQLPLVVQGDVNVPNTVLSSIAKPSIDARQSRIISAMYNGTEAGVSR
ncbi:MAG: hypothetical protein QM749_11015 [Aquabacterium sp.]